jgi:hypothetical protein
MMRPAQGIFGGSRAQAGAGIAIVEERGSRGEKEEETKRENIFLRECD